MPDKKFFRCTTCGDLHWGERAPDPCPTCGSPRSKVEEITKGEFLKVFK